MQRKENTVGNTFATAATTRAQEPSATPVIRFSKYVIGNQPQQQVKTPNNLNHLISPSFATKKATN